MHDSVLNDRTSQLIHEAMQVAHQADSDRLADITATASAVAATDSDHQLPALDMPVIIHILRFMPKSCIAAVAKLVCKEAHVAFKPYRRIDPACMDLPQVYLLDFLQQKATVWWQQERLMAAVAQHGDLERLQFLHKHGCVWNSHVYTLAARTGHIAVLQWAKSQDPPCPWPEHGCFFDEAARNRNMQVLRWAFTDAEAETRRSFCALLMVRAAVRYGDMAVLQVVQEAQPEGPASFWTRIIYNAAAGAGYLDVLQWIFESVPWDPFVCRIAAGAGHLHVLEWVAAHEPALPWDAVECLEAATKRSRVEVVGWLEARSSTGTQVQPVPPVDTPSSEKQCAGVC